MTGNGVKTWTGEEKPLVTVRRKSPRMLDSQGIGVLLALSDRNDGQATVESVEIRRVV
jgi:hypothetical protein